MKTFSALLLIVGLTGCETPPLRTRIISEPPGARIEVNGNYVGPAPVEVTLPQSGDRHRLKGRAIILALPTAPGQRLQETVLTHKQVVPEQVLFDMSFDRQAVMMEALQTNAPPPAATQP